MTHEPQTYQECLKARRQWFDEQMPALLPRIEKLTSDAYFNRTGRRLAFEIDYCAENGDRPPVAALSGSFNNCIFLKAPSELPNRFVCAVFRIPLPERKHARTIYHQEAATLIYLEKKTSIPAPRLIHYEYDKVMKMPYLILTRVSGQRLDSVAPHWGEIAPAHQAYVIEQIGDILNQLLHLKFDRIGGLGLLSKRAAKPEEQRIGVARRPLTYQMENAMTYGGISFDKVMSPHKTYSTAKAFTNDLMALHWRVFDRQDHLVHDCYDVRGDKSVNREFNFRRAFQTSLEEFQKADPKAQQIFRLQHPDLRAGNIMINPETYKVEAIIDWEFASVVPLTLYRLPTYHSCGLSHLHSEQWYEKHTPVWKRILKHVAAIENFDAAAFFASRSRHDHFYAKALMDVECISQIAQKASLFPGMDPWSSSLYSSEDSERVKRTTGAVRKYDRCLRTRYCLEELQALYKYERVQLELTKEASIIRPAIVRRQRSKSNP